MLDRAIEIAEDVARNTSLVSTTLMRDLMWRGPGSAEATHLLDSKILIGLFGGEDKREGVRSFLEKRSPRFEGTMEGAPGVWPWWEGVDVGVRTLEGRVEGEEKGEGREKEKAKAKL